MSLSSELRDKYITIIDEILVKSDLTTISEKRIRKGLQDVVGHDLTPQKVSQPRRSFAHHLIEPR
ncbi:unnamed protein product [Penicillium bialowiezense]